MGLDDHYRELGDLQPRDVIKAWSVRWPRILCHPLGEAVAHVARFTLRAGREDLEKAREHLDYALSIYHETEPPR